MAEGQEQAGAVAGKRERPPWARSSARWSTTCGVFRSPEVIAGTIRAAQQQLTAHLDQLTRKRTDIELTLCQLKEEAAWLVNADASLQVSGRLGEIRALIEEQEHALERLQHDMQAAKQAAGVNSGHSSPEEPRATRRSWFSAAGAATTWPSSSSARPNRSRGVGVVCVTPLWMRSQPRAV